MMQQIQSYAEYAMEQADTGEEPLETYEVEIVDDLDEADAEAPAPAAEPSRPEPASNGFDPFAGRGVTPVMPREEDLDEASAFSAEDDEFDDIPEDNATEIMDAAKDDDTADDIDDDEAKPKEPAGYRVQKPEEDFAAQEKLFSSIAEARANSSVDPEEDLNQGPSVEDIMAAFNREHGFDTVFVQLDDYKDVSSTAARELIKKGDFRLLPDRAIIIAEDIIKRKGGARRRD